MSVTDRQPPRRTVLVGAALGAAAATAAACSSGGDGAQPPAGTSDATSDPQAGPTTLATTSDVAVGSGVITDDVVITQPTAGVFKGFSPVCPHAGCKVSEIVDANIVCRCHGSRFDLDGAVVKGPATAPLATKAVVIRGDSIVEG